LHPRRRPKQTSAAHQEPECIQAASSTRSTDTASAQNRKRHRRERLVDLDAVDIGVLPRGAVREFSQLMKLRMIALADPWAARQMYICCKAGHLSAPAVRFMEFLRSD
jgi:hypothetical protein